MLKNQLFIEDINLPEPLTSEELQQLIIKMKNGNAQAKEIIALHNIKLVLHEVNTKFKNSYPDLEELVSIGCMGLAKAINTFEPSKNIQFSSYASRCIDNEILMYLRKISSQKQTISLDNNLNDEISYIDIIEDDYDFIEDLNNKDIKKELLEIINKLDERERQIILLQFGFYDKPYSQSQIAKKLSISQPHTSKLTTKTLKLLKNILEKRKIKQIHDMM